MSWATPDFVRRLRRLRGLFCVGEKDRDAPVGSSEPLSEIPRNLRNLRTKLSVSLLPSRLLYSIHARLGGRGLDLVAHEGLRAALRGGFLGRVVVYENRARPEFPDRLVRSLRWHPVRLLSVLDRPLYYAAKKLALDHAVARELRRGGYDLFHGWSGDALATLRAARERGVPSVLDIPTWHVRHGFKKWENVPPPRRLAARLLPRTWRERLKITTARLEEEYALADVILSRSACATETFLAEGFAPKKIFFIGEGTDTARFTPAPQPVGDGVFRALFVGALIERKGVHLLLEAWHRLRLPKAELTLVGHVHDEIRPHLARWTGPGSGVTVHLPGATDRVEDHYRRATVHVFPSFCEGCAKTTAEAAACGLPQITTRESGDVVLDGVNGRLVPKGDVNALTDALSELHGASPERMETMRHAARARAVAEYSWDRFRERLLVAYGQALGGKIRGVAGGG